MAKPKQPRGPADSKASTQRGRQARQVASRRVDSKEVTLPAAPAAGTATPAVGTAAAAAGTAAAAAGTAAPAAKSRRSAEAKRSVARPPPLKPRGPAEAKRSVARPPPLKPRGEGKGPAAAPAEGATEAAPAPARRGLPRRLGHYMLEKQLGAGGMGKVFRATDTRNDQRVALKMLFDIEPLGVYRLKREFRRMADIAHENLVTLHDLHHDDGSWYFTMELVSGRNLRDAMQACDWDGVRDLLRQLTRGVHALHQAGKIHRDLKPDNVMVTNEGRVVILDFGLVDETGRESLFESRGMIEGTTQYMAPEQAAAQLAVPASDWYAVGVILFEVLTDRWPFEADPLNDKQCMDAPPVSQFRPDVPRDLVELIAALLRRVPTERPGAAEILRWCTPRRSPPLLRVAPLAKTALIERDAAMAALYEALHGVTRGTPACVDLVGEAGVGKTAVAEQFAGEVAEAGIVALRGVCSPRESVPFRAFDGLLDALTAHLASYVPAELQALSAGLGAKLAALTQIFPVLAQVGWVSRATPGAAEPSEVRRRAFEGLKVLLYRIAERRPMVVVLDNLQWGDLDSAYLLNHLFASPGVPPALFVLAYRPTESPLLQMLGLQRTMSTPPYELREVRLGPLSPSGAGELVRRLRGRSRGLLDARYVGPVVSESGGNPALVCALVEEVERGGADRTAPPGEGDLLRRLVRTRLGRVTPAARELYARVVVADQAVPLALLQHAGAWSGDIRTLVVPLRGEGLLQFASEGDAPTIECTNEPLQHAALSILEPELLRRSHGDLATAYIVTNSAGSERVARHLHAAGRDEEAVEHAADAASAASRVLAFERAAELYALALECKPNQWTLEKNRAEALVQAGRGAEAAPLFLAAAEHAPAAAATRMLRAAAEHFFNYGHLERARRILDELLQAAGVTGTGAGPSGAALAEAIRRLERRGYAFVERSEFELSRREMDRIDLGWIAGKGLFINDPLQAGLFLVESTTLALAAGEPRRVARSLGLCGLLLSGRNDATGVAMLAEAQRIATRIRDPYAMGLAIVCRGIVARHRGQWRTALAEIDLGVQYLRDHCPGSVWECGLGQASTMAALEAMGELRVMSERSESLYQRAQAIGDIHSSRLAAIYSALTLLAAGKPRQARERVHGALATWPREGFHIQDLHALKIGVFCDLYERRPGDAWQRIQAVWPVLAASGFLELAARRGEAYLLRARAGLAVLRASGGGDGRVMALVTEDIARLEGEGTPHLTADALLLRAGLSACRGDSAGTLRHLGQAKQAFHDTGMGLHADLADRWHREALGIDDTRARARLDARMHMQNVTDIEAWMRVVGPGLVG